MEDILVKALTRQGNINSSSASVLSANTDNSWILDSEVSNHMIFDTTCFSTKTHIPHFTNILTACGNNLTHSYIGHVNVPSHLSVLNVYHVLNLSMNLLSVGQLVENGFECIFSSHGCQVREQQLKKVVGIGHKVNRLFKFIWLYTPQHSKVISSVTTSHLWYLRLRHVSTTYLNKLISDGLLDSVANKNINCIHCKLEKLSASSFNNSIHNSTAPFDLVHLDVWGPSCDPTIDGSRYYVVFIDNFSHYTWIYLLKSRSKVVLKYKYFAKMVYTQFSKKIKVFHSDSGGEYLSNEFRNFLSSEGTISQLSCAHTPQ